MTLNITMFHVEQGGLMKANTFTQAVYHWACFCEDQIGSGLNEDSYPCEELSQKIETLGVWVLKNHYGVLCMVNIKTGKIT